MTCGTIILIPYGLDSDGNLTSYRAPDQNTLLKWEKYGLVITRNEDDKPLTFFLNWTCSEMDSWLHGLFPEAFFYLADQHRELHGDAVDDLSHDELMWRLLEKKNTKVTLANKDRPDASTFVKLRTGKGKRWYEQAIFLGKKNEKTKRYVLITSTLPSCEV